MDECPVCGVPWHRTIHNGVLVRLSCVSCGAMPMHFLTVEDVRKANAQRPT